MPSMHMPSSSVMRAGILQLSENLDGHPWVPLDAAQAPKPMVQLVELDMWCTVTSWYHASIAVIKGLWGLHVSQSVVSSFAAH